MKVKCICNSDVSQFISIGKVYIVIEELFNNNCPVLYLVICDDNKPGYFGKFRFERIEENGCHINN